MKRSIIMLFLITIVCIIGFDFLHNLVFPPEHRLPTSISPHNTVMIFDIHHTLFKSDRREMIERISQLPNKRALLKLALNPFVWYEAYKAICLAKVSERVFELLGKHWPELDSVRPQLRYIANAQQPITETVEVARRFKEAGYPLYILSNIGPVTLEELKPQFPEIFALFDGTFTPTPEDNYLHKPNPLFYKKFKDYLAQRGLADKQLIFIDDIKCNIVMAYQEHMYGIHCTSSYWVKHLLSKIPGSPLAPHTKKQTA